MIRKMIDMGTKWIPLIFHSSRRVAKGEERVEDSTLSDLDKFILPKTEKMKNLNWRI